MKKYINTSNYYLSTITSKIENTGNSGTFDISDVTVDWVTLPETWYYWVDVDFGDVSKREIFRIVSRAWYTLTYDKRISPYWMKTHSIWSTVALRDFSELLNSLSTNTDNFWEVEKTWDLTVLVRWWKVLKSWEAKANTDVKTVPDAPFSFSVNSEAYIVLSFDDVAYTFAKITDVDLLTKEWQYPIAKIITWANTISEVIDLRSTVIGWWDMRKAIYDPTGIENDAFDYNNFYNTPTAESYDIKDIADTTNLRPYWSAKQEELISWVNIHTINGESILWPGNFPLNTILTVGWETANTANWEETFVFWVDSENLPLADDAFLVFTDSGTMLIKWWDAPNDYTYNSWTHTITFNSPLYEDEHAVVWVMYNNSTSQNQIGSANITLTYWENTASFNANQIEDVTIDLEEDLGLWDIANDSTITINQWWVESQSFTTNQANNETITLQGIIDVTQEEYNDLPESKTTDGNWYFIVEEAE